MDSHQSPALIVFSTMNSAEEAEQFAHRLIQDRLAACVHILPQGRSFYRWQGQVEDTAEYTLLIKTTASRYTELQTFFREQHPYDVPELIAVPITQGLPEYIHWIAQCTY